MKQFTGKILEIRINANQQRQAVVSYPQKLFPKPGQFIKAFAPTDLDSSLANNIFPSQYHNEEDKFTTAAPIPENWNPGTKLYLNGPFGNGFEIENSVKRIGLISLAKSPDRLLALAEIALEKNIELALFTNSNLPHLSHQIEANPLSAAENAYSWADMIAIDSPSHPFEEIFDEMGLPPGLPISCPSQILLHMPMPCAGLAECGVCTIKDENHQSLLACEDGPVFKFTSKGYRKIN